MSQGSQNSLSIGEVARQIGVMPDIKSNLMKSFVFDEEERRTMTWITKGYCHVFFHLPGRDYKRRSLVISRRCKKNVYRIKTLEEIETGISNGKEGFVQHINVNGNYEVDKTALNYQDRLVQFGYKNIEMICKSHEIDNEMIEQTGGIIQHSFLPTVICRFLVAV